MSEVIVPEGWAYPTINQCCNILDNKRIPLSDAVRQKKQGNIPYYGANGIVDYIDEYIFDENLILLAEDGGDFINYSTKPIAYKISGKSWINNHAHILKSKNSYYQDFIFYSLEHKDISYYINGGTRSKLNKSDLLNIEILIPESKQEQQKIAEILSEVDSAIEKTNQLIEKNKRLKTALMQDLLSYGIDENGKIRSPKTHKFKSSPLGDIPVEWEIKKIGDIYKELKTGSTPRRSNPEYFKGDILWVTSGELKYKVITNTIEKITKKAVQDTNLRIYPSGTFFIAITGLEAAGTRGSCAIIGKEATTNQSCMAFEANDEINTLFLFQYYLLHGEYISLYYAQGSKQQSLNNKIVAQIPIHVPPLQEQQKIADILSSQDKKIENLQKKLNKLNHLKASLMQDLLSGEVRVNKLMESN